MPVPDRSPSVAPRASRRPRPAVDLSARLGLVMKSLRADQQLSQEALADLADLDRTYVSSLERGLNRATLEVVGRLADLTAQKTDLQAQLTNAQAGTASEHKQFKAMQAQLAQAKRDQDEALRAQRQQLQKQSGEQLAKLQAALKTAQAQPTTPDPPQGDAGYVPNDTPATEATPAETSPAAPSESDLAFAFRNQCLEAVQAFFDGEPVNETHGGMATPERWIAASPYWFWNVNIRVSGTEHVEPFKCRSSRDKGFEALQGW